MVKVNDSFGFLTWGHHIRFDRPDIGCRIDFHLFGVDCSLTVQALRSGYMKFVDFTSEKADRELIGGWFIRQLREHFSQHFNYCPVCKIPVLEDGDVLTG